MIFSLATYVILYPGQVVETNLFNLRISTNLQVLPERTSLYTNSFVPSTSKEWTKMHIDVRIAG
jgi:hypothetical protein